MATTRVPRRRFLGGLLATGAVWEFGTADAPAQPFFTTESRWVLLGTGTGEGIYRARWHSETGELGPPELAAQTPQPTFLTLHPDLPVVYACHEDTGAAASISAFGLERRQATLVSLAVQPTHGDAPCYVSVDRTGRLLFTANYGGGSLAAFPLDTQGRPSPAARIFSCAASGLCGPLGPMHDRQEAPHLHCATLSPDNRFVLACDLGNDAILVFPIHPGAPHPLPDPLRIAARPGSGPRHLAFHPNGRWLYCIHELDATVDLYAWKVHAGNAQAELVADSVVSIRPSSTTVLGTLNTGAELAVTRDGRFLYTSTRGADLLTVFRLDEATGGLTKVQQLDCGGRTPRFFALDPTERWLLCAHQDGNSITTFARDPADGRLAQRATIEAPNPQCILWI